MTLPKLIGISGHAGVGKDSAAEYLVEHFEFVYTHAFADPLKHACAMLFGLAPDYFYDPKLKEQTVETWGVSPRMMAQFVGTELVREHMWKLLKADTEDFWVRRMEVELQHSELVYSSEDIVVIPDVRFQNEFDWIIRNNGYVIHLTRPGFEGKIGLPSHKSEAGIDFNQPERTCLIVNDGTLIDLHSKVDTLFRNIYAKFFPSDLI